MKHLVLVLALIFSVAFVSTTNGQELNAVYRYGDPPTFVTEDIDGKNVCPTNLPSICQGCCLATSTSQACRVWRQTGIDWDNEGTNSFWSLFGAFSSENVCKDLSTRAGQRIDEVARTQCGLFEPRCRVIDRGDFNPVRNIRRCEEPSCLFFFLWCSIDCTQISCIYNLDCDPI